MVEPAEYEALRDELAGDAEHRDDLTLLDIAPTILGQFGLPAPDGCGDGCGGFRARIDRHVEVEGRSPSKRNSMQTKTRGLGPRR